MWYKFKTQHFQSPIQPGIRLAKNRFVDVLPSNHYLLTDFYLFTFALCRNRDSKPLYYLRVTQRTIAGNSELVIPTNGSFPSFKISHFQTEAKYKTYACENEFNLHHRSPDSQQLTGNQIIRVCVEFIVRSMKRLKCSYLIKSCVCVVFILFPAL